MKFQIFTIIFLCLSSMSLYAELPFNWGKEELLARRLALRNEVFQQTDQTVEQPSSLNASNTRSVSRSVLFSAMLPGSGQFYSKSYIKAAVFLAVEVGAWAVNISYHKKGDNKDREFKQYADVNWSEYRYWSYVNWAAANDPNYSGMDLFPYNEYSARNGGKWYLIPEDYYNNNQQNIINTLREVESNKFSHRLPSSKTQQYYEMIGKYPMQFGNAWEDASFDRQYSGPDNITSGNNLYMDMRDESNRLYDISQYGVMVALVNHVISAIDAGFTARNYNRRQLKMEMSYQNYRYKNEYLNMLGMNLKW
jgi:hypothetical protein